MTLQASGQISLSDVNIELGTASNTQISMNDANPRSIASIASGEIAMSNFRGQTAQIAGSLWAWGGHSNILGIDNPMGYFSSPTQVGALTTWKNVGTGQGSAAVKTDGTLWVWGWNQYYFLGLGNNSGMGGTFYYYSPVQNGALTDWKFATFGSYSTFAIKTSGTLWCWGLNSIGQLGVGDANARANPTQIGILTNWKTVSSSDHTVAVKTDGTLWGWGRNNSGKLGLNGGVGSTYQSPVQIGTLNDWREAVATDNNTLAIKTDGTLWVCGSNSYGTLGLNDNTPRSSPVQVGSLNDWKIVKGGSYHNVAIKTNGTLWVWGWNYRGGLGLNEATTVNRSSPVQVGTLNNWKSITVSGGWNTALKTDGTIWAWGDNAGGQLGLNDITHRSSPVQVGTLTGWKSIFANFAIR